MCFVTVNRLASAFAALVLLASAAAGNAAIPNTWQLLPGPKGPGVDFNCRAILVDPDGVIYVGTRKEGVFRSRDGGQSWDAVNGGLKGSDIGKFAMGTNGDILLSLAGKDFSDEQRAYRLRKDENTWTLLPLKVSLCVNFTLNKRGELVAGVGWNGRIYISDDGGDSFTQVFKAPGAVYELVCLPNGDLVAGTEDVGVFRSSDDGRTWASLAKPLATATEKGSGNIQTIAANSKGDIFVGGRVYTGTAGIIRHVQGRQWVFASTGIPAIQPAGDMTGRSLLLGCDGNMYALAGNVYRSDDDGQTWKLFNAGLPDIPGMHGHLAQGHDGYLYFGLSGKGLYRTKAPIATTPPVRTTGTGKTSASRPVTLPATSPSGQ